MNKRVCLMLVLMTIVLVLSSVPAIAGTKGLQPRLVLLCVDNLTIQDVLGGQLPELRSMFLQGACALVNTNVAGGVNLDSAYLTLGAGARAKASAVQPGYMAMESLPTEEGTVAEIQARRTGNSNGAVFQPELTALIAANANLGYAVQPGVLGTTLQQAGYKLAVIGCADTDIPERPLVNAFMDSRGTVPYGFVGKSLFVRDVTGPYGFWTSNELLLTEAQRLQESADVIAIQWADLYRTEKYILHCQPAQAEEMRQEALRRLNQLVAELVLKFHSRDWAIALVTLFPSKSDSSQPQRLAPVAIWGTDVGRGLLTSPTTRRLGLVTNTDLTASILAHYEIMIPAVIMGRPITIAPVENSLSTLELLEQRATTNYMQRPMIIRMFIVYLIIVLGLSVLAALLNTHCLVSLVHRLLLAGVTVPLIFSILPLLPSLSLVTSVGLTILLAVIPALVTKNPVTSQRILLWIALFTVVTIACDVVLDQNLVSSSLLGYCFISGARYYGLGNEYMGIFIGALFTALGGMFEHLRFPSRLAQLVMIFVAIGGSYFLGANWLGANAGGTLAFIGGAGATYLWLGNKPNWIKIGGGLLGGTVLILVLMVTDWRLMSNSSHIGRALEATIEMGPQVLFGIIQRKVNMNLRLLRYSLWSRVLIMLIAALVAVFFGPYRNRPYLKYNYPLLTSCLRGSVVAVMIALLANDSGVVAAATLLLFPTSLLILLALPLTDKKVVKISKD